MAASAAFSIGTILAFFGGLGLVVFQNGHTECNSVLVQAFNQGTCQEISAVWTLGIIGLVVGMVLIIVGAILRSREQS
jgi:hypothetical protein